MKLSNPKKNQILIILSKKEFSDIFKNHGFKNSQDITNAFENLLKSKIIKKLIPQLSGRISLKISVNFENCFIFIQKNHYNNQKEYMLIFNDFENIEVFSENFIYDFKNSSLYLFNNLYYLIFFSDTDKDKIIPFCKEFCLNVSNDSKKISAIKEYGRIICPNHAIEKLKSKRF